MIIYIFSFSKTFFYYADNRDHENHKARNSALGCAQTAYNLKYNLKVL